MWNNSTMFDKRLSSLRPPHTVNRTPRLLSDLKHYKAFEFCSMLVMYMPMPYAILSEKQFQHAMYLSHAIFLPYKHRITVAEITDARSFIEKFCTQFENIYVP